MKPQRDEFDVWRFEQVMHLKPRNGSTLCPSSKVRRDEVLQSCQEQRDKGLPPNWQELDAPLDAEGGLPIWLHLPYKADLRDCEQLAVRLDEEQCMWDGSWIPEFREEFERTRAVSVSFWMHARETSLGMPKNFWPAISLYSRLANPIEFFRQYEESPHTESSWFVYFTTGNADYQTSQSENDIERRRITVRHTDKVPYSTDWTHVHLSLEEIGGDVRCCMALNFRYRWF